MKTPTHSKIRVIRGHSFTFALKFFPFPIIFNANVRATPFDPRDNFHTYGCWVRQDLIIWHVDGVEIGRKKNQYWHRKMNVALSLGLRAPYAIFQQNRLIPNPDQQIGEGFPTSMKVDYVRVWDYLP